MSITVTGQSLVDLASKLSALGASLTTLGGIPTEEKTKKTRKTKPKVEEEEDVDLDETDDSSVEDLEEETDDEDIDLDEDADDEEETTEDEDEKIDAKQLAQLKKALNGYSAKHGKPKAVKILHKYAKVSQDVKTEDFSKIMKALKV